MDEARGSPFPLLLQFQGNWKLKLNILSGRKGENKLPVDASSLTNKWGLFRTVHI